MNSLETSSALASAKETRGPRVPVDHPLFIYPPSNNPYSAKIQDLRGLVFSDQDTESFAGKWRDQFLNLQTPLASRELHVEIGCNAGHVVVEWAKAHPHHLYLGMDWKFKPIHRAAEKSIKAGLNNVKFLRAHAERAPFMFGPKEIDRLCLYFPDPWPKKAHWKNRFVTPERLKQLSKLIKPTGIFHIKTDHPGYFEWILDAIEGSSQPEGPCWKVLEMTRNLHESHPRPELLQIPDVTLFEKLFIRDGIPIQSLKLQPTFIGP